MARILVVDDEVGIRELLSEILYDEGHTVELAENAAQARARAFACVPTWCCWTSDARHRWREPAQGMGLPGHAGHAGDHDERPRHHRHRGRGHPHRRHGFPGKPITLQRLLKTVAAGLARGRAPHLAPAAAHPSIASAAVALEDELDLPPLTTAPAGEVPVTSNGQLGSISLTSPARGARRVRAHLFRIPPGPGKPQHDPGVRAHRPRTHPPLPQAQAIGYRVGSQAGA